MKIENKTQKNWRESHNNNNNNIINNNSNNNAKANDSDSNNGCITCSTEWLFPCKITITSTTTLKTYKKLQ